MNDLGFALAWLAAQVACLLAPAAVLQLRASRRGPASGAWVATWSLGLAAGLGIVSLLTGVRSACGPIQPGAAAAPAAAIPATPAPMPRDASVWEDSDRVAGRPLPALRWPAAWKRLGRRATGPAGMVRGWGRAFALVALGGMGLGLLRLLLGLWAIRLCRRRGAPIDDPALIGLVEELRTRIGCHRSVAVLEVRDSPRRPRRDGAGRCCCCPAAGGGGASPSGGRWWPTSWPTSSGATTRRACWPGWPWR